MSLAMRPAKLVFSPLIFAALLVAGCSSKPASTGVAPVAQLVKVVTVVAAGRTDAIDYPGVVTARVEMPLAFRIPGKLLTRLVNLGDHVDAGQVLARLDDADLHLALQNADAAVRAAAAQRDNAKAERDRLTTLLAKGFATQSVVDQAQAAFAQADSALNSATASRDQAANQSSYAILKADRPGIITALPAEASQVVAAGQPVVTLATDGPRDVAFAVPETAVTGLAVGDVLAVKLWANTDQTLSGTVRQVSGSADPTSRTYAVRLSIADADWIHLGMSAVVSGKTAATSGGVIVPLGAIGQDNGTSVVWVVDSKTETVSARPVFMRAFAGEGVEVTSGLKSGEVVVAAGTQFMTPGQHIRIAAEDESSL